MTALHCWQDRGDWYERQFGLHSEQHLLAAYVDESAICMLPAGHAGHHVWTTDDKIGVTFEENA